jgi:hypothetical protein
MATWRRALESKPRSQRESGEDFDRIASGQLAAMHESGSVQVFGRRNDGLSTHSEGGGRKAPRHEVAGSWALAEQRAL